MTNTTNTKTVTPITRQYISINEGCHLFGGLNRSTIHRWIKAGKINGYKIGGRTLLDLNEINIKISQSRIVA